MTVTTETARSAGVRLSPEQLDADILAAVTAASGTAIGTAIAARTDHGVVDVLVALARLTNSGRIERVAPGRYRAAAVEPMN